MALANNFYRGNNILNDKVLDDYANILPEVTHKTLYNHYKAIQKDSITKIVYIVTIGKYGKSLKFLGTNGKGNIISKQTLTKNVTLYNSYIEALLDVIQILKNNSDYGLYKIHEIDISTLE